MTDSAEESRLTFDPFVDEERAKPAAKGLLWLVGLAVPIAALVWVVLGASWLWSLAPGLLISLALVSSSFEPDKEKRRWRRLRSLSIVARSGSWELIEGFINIEAPTIRRLTPPLSFDASAGEAGLIHIGDEELRLPPRAADEQRRLVELLQAAWEQRSFDEA